MPIDPSAAVERALTLFIVIALTIIAANILLRSAAPEYGWDEADYLSSTSLSWHHLWSSSDYALHWHGPLSIYLAKAGSAIVPATPAPETRFRYLVALVGSLAVGALYWALRHPFGASRTASLVAAGLLLLSVIRSRETDVVGPHHLMLLCTIVLLALAYQWREKPGLKSALVLGTVVGIGALTSTYIIPVAVCAFFAVWVAGKNWISADRLHLKLSWSIPILIVTAVALMLVFWPPGILRFRFIKDFSIYLRYSHHTTLVGNQIYETTPRSALVYWLVHLEAPIFLASLTVIPLAYWKARKLQVQSSKHAYLLTCVAFFLTLCLAAHLAGARNLLQLVGVLCLAVGALLDEVLGSRTAIVRVLAAAVVALAVVNFIWLSRYAHYTPYIACDGYRAFLSENQSRLSQKARAQVYGMPILDYYARETATAVGWDAEELPWTTRADAPLPDDVQYVLVPAFIPDSMPPDQPIRRIVAEHWKLVWRHPSEEGWELRLYERP